MPSEGKLLVTVKVEDGYVQHVSVYKDGEEVEFELKIMDLDNKPEKYRAIGYIPSDGHRLNRETVSYDQAAKTVDQWQAEGRITGGHVEMYVKGFGWVVAESEEVTG